MHRDIKPANILVAEDDQPRLLDFGIAKLIEEREDGVSPRTTVLLLTPDYASPEQVRGEPVTTSTDIYSLGCVLYELLTGKRPHAFSTRTPGELERVICEVEPIPPGHIAPLDEDLDNIILKALRKDPAMRFRPRSSFRTISAVTWTDGRCRPGRSPLVCRAKKFVRRNRIAVAAVAAAMSAVVIGAAAALWQAHNASEQRELAERRAADGRRLANTILFTVEEKIRNLFRHD